MIEVMADGYHAHLFQLHDEEPHHLIQCGCWICHYRRELKRELPDRYEVSEIGLFNANPIWLYWNIADDGFFK